jgi:hypothetical protein
MPSEKATVMLRSGKRPSLAFPINYRALRAACNVLQHCQRSSAKLSWAFSIEVDLFLYKAGPPVRGKIAPEI